MVPTMSQNVAPHAATLTTYELMRSEVFAVRASQDVT